MMTLDTVEAIIKAENKQGRVLGVWEKDGYYRTRIIYTTQDEIEPLLFWEVTKVNFFYKTVEYAIKKTKWHELTNNK